MNKKIPRIKVGINGTLMLEGKALKEGDLLEIDILNDSNWTIGQVEKINGEYQISLFDSEFVRIKLHKGGYYPIARVLARRPCCLPDFGKPFPSSDNIVPFLAWLAMKDMNYEISGLLLYCILTKVI